MFHVSKMPVSTKLNRPFVFYLASYVSSPEISAAERNGGNVSTLTRSPRISAWVRWVKRGFQKGSGTRVRICFAASLSPPRCWIVRATWQYALETVVYVTKTGIRHIHWRAFRPCVSFPKVKCGYRVLLECATRDAEIFYTVDGSYPVDCNAELLVSN